MKFDIVQRIMGSMPIIIISCSAFRTRTRSFNGIFPAFGGLLAVRGSLTVGNELGGSDFDLLGDWMAECKAYDSRHLYSASTARTVSKADDFMVTHHYPGVGGVRGRLGGRLFDGGLLHAPARGARLLRGAVP